MSQITTCPRCGGDVEPHDDNVEPPTFCESCDWPLAWPVTDGPVVESAPDEPVDLLAERSGIDVFARQRQPRTGQQTCWNCGELNARTATSCVLCGESLDGPPREQPGLRPPRTDACTGEESRQLISVPGPVLVGLGLVLLALITFYAGPW